MDKKLIKIINDVSLQMEANYNVEFTPSAKKLIYNSIKKFKTNKVYYNALMGIFLERWTEIYIRKNKLKNTSINRTDIIEWLGFNCTIESEICPRRRV